MKKGESLVSIKTSNCSFFLKSFFKIIQDLLWGIISTLHDTNIDFLSLKIYGYNIKEEIMK